MIKFKIISRLILASLVVSCSTLSTNERQNFERKKIAEEIIAPYLSEARETAKRFLAADTESSVTVYLPQQKISYIPLPEPAFNTRASLSESELGRLASYLQAYRAQIGAAGSFRFDLKFLNQLQQGARTFVRFQQIIKRRVVRRKEGERNEYITPIDGAVIVATFENSKLVKLNSTLMVPPTLSLRTNPGYQLALTENEFAVLMELLKGPDAPVALKDYFANIARRNNLRFNYEDFLNRNLREQRILMTRFFRSLNVLESARLLMDQAYQDRLSLVRYGQTWMFQVTEFFGLPIQVDFELPAIGNQKTKIKNLRFVHHSAAPILGFESPFFPAGTITAGGNGAYALAMAIDIGVLFGHFPQFMNVISRF